jgi:hypothetical protein
MVMDLDKIKADFNNIILNELTNDIYVVRAKEFSPNSIGDNTRQFEILSFLGTPYLKCRRSPIGRARRQDVVPVDSADEEIFIGTQSALTGLILHLTFNESDDYKTIAYDKSGKGYNATLTNFIDTENARVGSRFGIGFAGNFNTYTDNYGVITDNTDLKLLGDFSVCFWIYILSLTNHSDILEKLSTNGYRCRIDYVNKRIYFSINASSYVSTNDSLAINTWYHIAITRNDTNLKIYINGVENSSYDAPPKVNTLSNNLIIGNNSSFNLKLRGYLDDLKIFNTVLTQDQIRELMKIEEVDISYYDIRGGDRIYNSVDYPSTSDFGYKVVDSVEQWQGFLRLKLRNETV